MEFIADPDVLDVVNLLELVDNALADVAEGSDVIGQNPDIDAHVIPPISYGPNDAKGYGLSCFSLPHKDHGSSDYEIYSLFSRRMSNIMRRFTPQVEEYSIDEAFADITGMRRALRG